MESREGQLNQEGERGEIDWSANELVLPTNLEMVVGLVDELKKRLADFGWSEKNINRVFVAADEALTNALVHGNLDLPGIKKNIKEYFDSIREATATELGQRHVFVSLDINKDRAVVKIRDEGKGIPTENIPDPTLEENQSKEGGRGLLIINGLADSVAIHDNEIEMIFENK